MEKSPEIDEITGQVVDAAFKLHTRFGPGLLESVYELVLARELEQGGLTVERIVNNYRPSPPRLSACVNKKS